MREKQYSTKELIRRFLPFYKPYMKIQVLDLICASLTTVCELVLPMIMRSITNDAIVANGSLAIDVVVKLSMIYLLLRLIDCGAYYFMAYIGHVMGSRIETDMRTALYEHLQKLSDSFYNNTKVGQIMGRITSDLFDVTEFAHHCPEEFFIAAIKIIISFVLLLRINVVLTLVIYAFIPIMIISSVKLRKNLRTVFMKQRHQIGELNARVEDSLFGQRVVKTFTNEEVEMDKFEHDNQKFMDIKRESYKNMGAFHTLVRFFDGIMYLTVLLLGGILLTKGHINAGDLIAFLLYVTTMIASVRRLIEFAEQFQRGITGIERFYQLMDEVVDIYDKPEGAVELSDIKGNIKFEDVSFTYKDDNNKVFNNLNINIKPGEKIAIVGPSGGGKTTLCNLIPRFYDTTSGMVSIDGVDIKDFTLKSLRSNIGMVQQDIYLFSGTIKENIGYGRIDATDEEIIDAAKKAGAHEFILDLKNGYDTYVGERGVKLSGGQKQRISIARVFLKNPPIIILDEATSALDNESEYLVAQSLDKLAHGRTTITIAHRLSTVRNSDRILVLTVDGIVESGNHKELLEQKGTYYKLYEMSSALN